MIPVLAFTIKIKAPITLALLFDAISKNNELIKL